MPSKAELAFKALHPEARSEYVAKDANGHKRIGVFVGEEYFACGPTRGAAYAASLVWIKTKAEYKARQAEAL